MESGISYHSRTWEIAMTSFWSWLQSPEFLVLAGFHVFILLMLALDLGVFQRQAHVVSMREAAAWSAVWIGLALLFAAGIWRFWGAWHPVDAAQIERDSAQAADAIGADSDAMAASNVDQSGQVVQDDADAGPNRAIEFLTGYLIEKSLSVDNLFVFLVIFRYFAVPPRYQHRVLLWGIIGALILRATLIVLGAVLLAWFHWMIYVFGVFLLYTAYKLALAGEHHVDPGRNRVLRLLRRFFPVVDDYDSPHFWVRRDGRLFVTPLLVVLVVIESTDVVFALDSIPAVFAVTRDTFIVYTSNIFAILGLRALYFLLAGFLGMFRYLHVGLAAVLGFVGIKMLVEEPLRPYFESYGVHERGLILLSLGVIACILGIAVGASLWAGPKPNPDVK
jgi:tellurite resistance protein TerC